MLLVFIFILKFLARTNIFNHIREKHGLNTLRSVRRQERLLKRHEKLKLDINFLLTCKRESLTPNFAQPKLSIKSNARVRKKIGNLILETEINNKHRMKKELLTQIKTNNDELKEMVPFLIHKAVQYRLRTNISKRMTKWKAIHLRKLDNLRKKQRPTVEKDKQI